MSVFLKGIPCRYTCLSAFIRHTRTLVHQTSGTCLWVCLFHLAAILIVFLSLFSHHLLFNCRNFPGDPLNQGYLTLFGKSFNKKNLTLNVHQLALQSNHRMFLMSGTLHKYTCAPLDWFIRIIMLNFVDWKMTRMTGTRDYRKTQWDFSVFAGPRPSNTYQTISKRRHDLINVPLSLPLTNTSNAQYIMAKRFRISYNKNNKKLCTFKV